MRYLLFITLAFAAFLSFSCVSKNIQSTTSRKEGVNALSSDSLAQNIKTLASDAFLGRKPFTEGETKTINFLQTRFRKLGLEPGNGNSYLQEVPMVNIETAADSVMKVQAPDQTFFLKGFEDYVVWTEKTDPVVSLTNDELVFAGYGVVAPEHNWNDYAGLDVRGKVVLVMVNDPGFGADATLFKVIP